MCVGLIQSVEGPDKIKVLILSRVRKNSSVCWASNTITGLFLPLNWFVDLEIASLQTGYVTIGSPGSQASGLRTKPPALSGLHFADSSCRS